MTTLFGKLTTGLTALHLVLCAATALAEPPRKPGGQIKQGKWVGYVQPDGSPDAIALTMDCFLVQPDDQRESPRLNLLFKLGLGGYGTPEYESQIFEALDYNYEEGLLTLDNPRNDMLITASVYASPRTQMEGRVVFRSSALAGKLFLDHQTDEPGGTPPKPPPLAPLLAGQYEGLCGDEKAVLQLETGRDLIPDASPSPAGLEHYQITGAVGVENGQCSSVNGPDRPIFCVDHGFSSGTYDFVGRKLFLTGTHETEDCAREEDGLSCRIRFVSKDPNERLPVERSCRFRRPKPAAAPFKAARRRFHVTPSAAEKAPLPKSAPPLSKALVAAANGSFLGYLHHEGRDVYQPVRLNVVATASTDNLHVENNVFVSVLGILYFSRGVSDDFATFHFDRRVLYVVPGYSLGSRDSDTFLQVSQWTNGFVSGVWYSHAYGRIGTFEAVKGTALPPLPVEARVIESAAGVFRGPDERSQGGRDYWDARVVFSRQPTRTEKHTIFLQGNYRLHAGGVPWPTRRISQGTYDFYTGAVAWLLDDPNGDAKLVTGFVDGPDMLKLFWPNDRVWAVSVLDRFFGSHRRHGRSRE